jgi:hypothetical protein
MPSAALIVKNIAEIASSLLFTGFFSFHW